MNLFTALVLSTRKQAKSFVSRPIGVFMREAYLLVVSDNTIADDSDIALSQPYLFEIFAVTYPDKADGKGWGDPKVAKDAHFSKVFSEDELVQFCEKHEFSFSETWQPVENDDA